MVTSSNVPKGTDSRDEPPKDTDIPEIGDEVAAAWALHALADALLAAASEDIEAVRHELVHLGFTGPVGVQRQT